MPGLAIGFGLALVALGGGFFIGTGSEHATALIPVYFGLALMLLGAVALRGGTARKHAMHAAAAVGLLGVLGGAGMGLPKLPKVLSGEAERPTAVIEQLLLGLICAAFVGLCVNSFVQARRARGTTPPA
jgi:hypothetical protein